MADQKKTDDPRRVREDARIEEAQAAPLVRTQAAATKPYRLKKDGKHSILDPATGELTRVKPGEVVQLTDRQAKAFADRFDPA